MCIRDSRYNPDLKIGDTVEVYIENQEDKKGQLVLSHRKARATRSWDRVNADVYKRQGKKELLTLLLYFL